MGYDESILDNIIINANKKELCQIKEMIDKELNKRKKEEQEKYRQSHSEYIGKCFISKDNAIKIANFNFDNEYHMMCFVLNSDLSKDETILCLDSIGLFCNDHNNPGHKVIEQYSEITDLQFEQMIFSKIDQLVFGQFKCQG